MKFARQGAASAGAALFLLLAGCGSAPPPGPPPPRPEDVRAEIVRLLPQRLADRAGWAADIYAAFAALQLAPSRANLCGVLAVTEQESGFAVNPVVPHLGQTAWDEIDRRAQRLGVPAFVVHAALHVTSPDGRSYAERIDAARTEHDLSRTFEDLIGQVPLGHRLFDGLNPVRTVGPMQVSVAFAEREAQRRDYPYPVGPGGLREELFTRRGGMYFGVAHLLAYTAPYDRMLYRFADFNAGQYASRNAAFQNALGVVSGIALVPDGALLRHGADADAPSATELAARSAASRLGEPGEREIHDALAQADAAGFERSALYRRVFEEADRIEGRPLPRAAVPQITLHGPKLTRTLSTQWYAERVESRYRRCLR